MQPDHRQTELALDHSPAMEAQMRALFETRWRRWHRCSTYEAAVQDPITRELLYLAASHLPSLRPTLPRRRGARP